MQVPISIAGRGSLIGKEIGKVIGLGTRIMICRTCDKAASEQEEPKQHDCRLNWCGT